MSFIDKILPKRHKEVLRPHCKVNPDETMDCNYEWKRSDGITEVTKEPIRGRVVGGRFEILDTGDASDEGIERLRRHIEKNALEK